MASKNPTYECVTSMGTFEVELFVDKMPITASNWIDLAESGFYNGLTFHRVINNFMLQFGCPHSRGGRTADSARKAGTGGPNPGTKFANLKSGAMITRNSGGNIPDELLGTAKISNTPGTLSMANTGQKDTGGSQFFINTKHNNFLDWFDKSSPSAHPVFGKVTKGFNEVIKKIEVTKTSNDKPTEDVKMVSITKKK